MEHRGNLNPDGTRKWISTDGRKIRYTPDNSQRLKHLVGPSGERFSSGSKKNEFTIKNGENFQMKRAPISKISWRNKPTPLKNFIIPKKMSTSRGKSSLLLGVIRNPQQSRPITPQYIPPCSTPFLTIPYGVNNASTSHFLNSSTSQTISTSHNKQSFQWNREDNLNTRPWTSSSQNFALDSDSNNDEDIPPWQRKHSQMKIGANNNDYESENMHVSKTIPEPEPEAMIEISTFEYNFVEEDTVQFTRYNDLGFEEDQCGRVICYIEARSLLDYIGNMKTGFGIFFSPFHPCNLSANAKIATNVTNGGVEAAAEAINRIWKYNLKKIAICYDAKQLYGFLFQQSSSTNSSEQERIQSRLMKKIQKLSLVSFVPLKNNYNEVYKSEAQYLASLAAGLCPTPPPSLIKNHICSDESFEVGDTVSIRFDDTEGSMDGVFCRGLFKIKCITRDPTVYILDSMLRAELNPQETEIVTVEDLHLVKKNEVPDEIVLDQN